MPACLRAALVAALCASPALAAAQDSGVDGSVTVSPARPGPVRRGDDDRTAYGAARIVLLDARGRIAARAVADEQGRFSLSADPGIYSVEVDTQGAPYPRCEPVEAHVRPRARTPVRIDCDSGMR